MESLSNQLRMRDNATVRKIKITEKNITEFINAKEYHRTHKRDEAILTGRCCVCSGEAVLEVFYPLPYDLLRKEKYCEDCIKKVYQREQVL